MGSISDDNSYNMKQQSSPTVRRRVEFLRLLQSQYDELEADFLEERKVLEAKYQKLYEPLYKKRYEIVNGIKEVEGVKNEVIIERDNATKEKGVPEFWLTAMKTHHVLGEEIKGRDEGALKFLNDINCSRLHDPQGFKLEFYFNPNPYFKNSVLTKTYHLIDEADPVLDQAFGTEIVWHPGKCLTKKVVKKKPRVGSKNTKPITTIENCESFFTFFNPPEFPKDEDDLDDDAYEKLLDRMEQDYNMGTIIRDKIIPHAVSWFTGEAIEEGDDGFDADDNSDDDEDDETEDDEDEDEDENEKEEDKMEDTNKDKDNEEDEEEEKGKINWKKDVDEDDNGDEEQEEETRALKKGMDMDEDTEDDEEEEGERTTKKDMDDDEDTNDSEEEEEEENGNQGWKRTSDGPKQTGGQVQPKENPAGCKRQLCWVAQI